MTPVFRFSTYSPGDGLSELVLSSFSHSDEVHLIQNIIMLVVCFPIVCRKLGVAKTIILFLFFSLMGVYVGVEIFGQFVDYNPRALGMSGGTFALLGIVFREVSEKHSSVASIFLVIIVFHQLMINQSVVSVGAHTFSFVCAFILSSPKTHSLRVTTDRYINLR